MYAGIFFVTLAALSVLFLDYSKAEAVKSAGNELGLVWAESILGEYDRNLAERYGIYGYYGNDWLTKQKFDYLVQESTEGKRYLSFEGSSLRLTPYVLTDPSVFRKQVIKMGELITLKKWKNMNSDADSNESGKDIPTGSEDPGIRNAAILHTLPSYGKISGAGMKNPVSVLKKEKGQKTLQNIIKKSGEEYLENEYILSFFRNRGTGSSSESYFTNEVEYILSGKTKDSENQKAVKRKILAVREFCNLLYLETSPDMQAVIHSAAIVVAPESVALAAQIIAAGWALAESNNDYQLLISGEKVPLWKDQDSWALSLDQILIDPKNAEEGHRNEEWAKEPEKTGKEEEQVKKSLKEEMDFVVNPENEHGETYEDYLLFFLFLMEERAKLFRIMDLIQINMQYLYSSSFYLRDHYAGLSAVFMVNGNEIHISKLYQS